MTILRKIVIFTTVAVGVVLLSVALYKRDTIYIMLVPGPSVGVKSPPFTVSSGEHTVSLAQLKGKTVLLHFMAGWCRECVKELPQIQSSYDDLKSDPDVVFINVAFREDQKDTLRFLQRKGYSLPVYADASGSVARTLGIGAIPATVVIDAKGMIVAKLLGEGKLKRYLAR